MVATSIWRSLSFCCLRFSCDPCPPKMTLTSLSTRGKAPPPPPPAAGVVVVLLVVPAVEEEGGGAFPRVDREVNVIFGGHGSQENKSSTTARYWWRPPVLPPHTGGQNA